MSSLQDQLESRLLGDGADLVGFADLSTLALQGHNQMQTAIAVGISYDPGIVARLDSEVDAFWTHLQHVRKKLEVLLQTCEHWLKQEGFGVWIPPISTNLPGLLGDFPHKTAATRAGLGWIGKSSLFVSREFGCDVRLATVLTNAPFVPGKPVTEDRCGSCVECVRACPYGAIRGASWHPGIERDRLLDAYLCSSKREGYIPRLGYKHPCGLCIKACPVRNRGRRQEYLPTSV